MINIAELEKKFDSLNKFNLVFASFFFSLMTLCVKNIDKRIPIYELVLFRSLLSLIITLFIINQKKINPWGKNRYKNRICILYDSRYTKRHISYRIKNAN